MSYEFAKGRVTAAQRLYAFADGMEEFARYRYIRAALEYLQDIGVEGRALAVSELKELAAAQNAGYVFGVNDVRVRTAVRVVSDQWSSRSIYFAYGFVAGLLDHRSMWPAPFTATNKHYTDEEQPMASEGIFHPHTVVVTIPGVSNGKRYQFDPAYFELKKDDTVVVRPDSGGLLVATVNAEPEPYSHSSPLPLVVDRVDLEQYEARKERQANIDKARLLLKEAAKRNTEQDLFDAVKAKLSPEEMAFIAGTLGLGTEKPNGDTAKQG